MNVLCLSLKHNKEFQGEVLERDEMLRKIKDFNTLEVH